MVDSLSPLAQTVANRLLAFREAYARRNAAKKGKDWLLLERENSMGAYKDLRDAQLAAFLEDREMLLALSGGMDSVVLFHIFLELRAAGLLQFACVHINHRLRQASEEEEAHVVSLCERYDVALNICRWQHGEIHEGVEAMARLYRYHAMAHVLKERNSQLLVTAHHQEDQAETVLMRLIEGYHAESLRAMQEVSPLFTAPEYSIWRPLLATAKAEMISYAQTQRLAYDEDESNTSLTYFRNRLRLEIMPLLREENPEVGAHFNALASEIAGLSAWARLGMADRLAKDFTANDLGYQFSMGIFADLNTDQQLLLLRELLKQVDRDFLAIGRQGLRALLAFLLGETPQGEWCLPKDYCLVRIYQTAYILPQDKRNELLGLGQCREGVYPVDGKLPAGFVLDEMPLSGESLALESIRNLKLRHRLSGDWLYLGNGHKQKLRRFFINQKLSQAERQRAWLLADGGQILGIYLPRRGWLYRYPVAHPNFWLRVEPDIGDWQ